MTNNKINTAVVVLNWNGVDFLQKFIPILIKNTSSDIAEIIVADNASTDNSVKFLQDNFPEVKLIILKENYGYAEGYNQAIAQLNHKYTVLINSDIEVAENWLEPLVVQMESSSDIAACQPKIRDYKQKEFFEYAGAAGGYIDYLGYPFCRGRIFDSLEKDLGQYEDSKSIFWATGACIMVNTAIYKELGGLDSDFFAHMEEIDLCWRIKSRAYEIYYVPDSTVFHVGGGTLSKLNPKKTFLNFRNNLLLLYKNLPANKLNKILFIRMILDGIAAIKFMVSFQFSHALAILKAHFSFYKLLSQFKNKRKENLEKAKTNIIKEIYPKSILKEYFIHKKDKFFLLEW